MSGMTIRATGLPACGASSMAGTGSGSPGSGTVVEVVVVDSAASSASSNCRSRRSCACAVRIPVPQSWYATNSRIRVPRVMQVRPTAPRTRASRMAGQATGALPCLGRAGRPSVDFPDSMEPVVQLREAVTLLGRFPALAGIDLEVAVGEVVLLRGPNGAGKTTLLRCCAGLVPLARGEGRVLGHDLMDRRNVRALRRRVGLLGHDAGLYAELTVADNVRFWGRAAGARRADVDAAMDACGLSGRLAGLPVARLSAGQRR